MKKSGPIFILLSLCLLGGCLEDTVKVDPPIESPYTPEEQQVIANCYIVQEAVDEFGRRNSGVYPWDASVDTTLDGSSLIDLLPSGLLLVNPFTALRTEPVHGSAVNPGETGYYPFNTGGVPVDYTITGFGEEDIILTLTKDGPLE